VNLMRMAHDDGAKLRFYSSEKHGTRVNRARQAKKELGLSGRQLKKLRKQIAREERAEARARQPGAPRRPPSPRPGP